MMTMNTPRCRSTETIPARRKHWTNTRHGLIPGGSTARCRGLLGWAFVCASASLLSGSEGPSDEPSRPLLLNTPATSQATSVLAAEAFWRSQLTQTDPSGTSSGPVFSAPESIQAPSPETTELPQHGLAPISALGAGIAPPAEPDGNDELPPDEAAKEFANWPTISYRAGAYNGVQAWTLPRPSATFCHRPLYFEELNLERYGRSAGVLQPVVSAARFFATIPTLPYQSVARHPDVCYYPCHPYPAGRPAPWVRELPPLDGPAGLAQAGVIVGLIFLIP
jgi:hypothetical protein